MCDPSIGRAEVARTRNHSVLLPGFVMTTEIVFGGAREQMMMRHRLGDRTWAALSCHPAPSGGSRPGSGSASGTCRVPPVGCLARPIRASYPVIKSRPPRFPGDRPLLSVTPVKLMLRSS
jgi:hypothetical protein